MKRRMIIKKLWRIFSNLIMLLSLAACDSSCDMNPGRAIIQVFNRSSMTVRVSVEGNQGQDEQRFIVLAPDDAAKYVLEDELFYMASGEPVDNWLAVAEGKRQDLLAILSMNPTANGVVYKGKGVNELRTELSQLTEEIRIHKGTNRIKRCRGVTGVWQGGENAVDIRSIVVITDGELVDTIIVACLYR
jgi:hypothetical protein